MGLRIYNTLTAQKEDFVPLTPGKVGMYVCGVTTYDLSHVGHARVYVAFDVVQRWLRRSFDVTYVRNFTDVDDKIIKRANENGEDPIKLAARYCDEYHKDMEALGVMRADVEPRVSETIPEIIDFVDDLVKKGYAYRIASGSEVEGAGDDVYFRVAKFDGYTRLSKKNLDDLMAGARVGVDERKENPLDFALWKSAKPGEPYWESPFGKGRPGWHIECSAMSEEHLGETFDIHAGGKDLIFPHHTNEIAQSEARHDGKQYVRYWMHNGFVNVRDEKVCPVTQKPVETVPEAEQVTADYEGDTFTFVDEAAKASFLEEPAKYLKMSKSLGNFFTIRDILGTYTGESLRWLLLSTHYRSPIAFHPRLVEEAERKVAYVYETLRGVQRYLEENQSEDGPGLKEVFGSAAVPFDPWADFSAGLDDDFSTPVAVAAFNEMLKIANLLITGREKEIIGRKLKPADRARLLNEWTSVFTEMRQVLGIGEQDPAAFLLAQRELRCKARDIDPAEVERLIEERATARAAKDFARADVARDALKALGVEVRDGRDGTEWSVA